MGNVILWKQNCKICGHVSSAPICDQCIGTVRSYYDEIVRFLDENPKSTVIEVYGHTSIPYNIIKAFVEFDWLQLELEDEETRIRSAEVLKVAKNR